MISFSRKTNQNTHTAHRTLETNKGIGSKFSKNNNDISENKIQKERFSDSHFSSFVLLKTFEEILRFVSIFSVTKCCYWFWLLLLLLLLLLLASSKIIPNNSIWWNFLFSFLNDLLHEDYCQTENARTIADERFTNTFAW